MEEKDSKENQQNRNIGFIAIAVIIAFLWWFGRDSKHSSSAASSSNSVTTSHTCLQCGKSYTGYGWMTVNGEQYQPSSDNGDQYCSKTCAYDSQPAKWKH